MVSIPGLRVTSRTSGFVFKGRQVDIREIGRQLQVEMVLEGSVRKTGNRLRITAQLIQVADDYHLWSERYDREMKDIFELQDEIARSIAKALRIQLAAGPGRPPVRAHTGNIEAYHLFLKGRHCWATQTPDGLLNGIRFFEEAIAEDPSYASAYAGLSDCHRLLGFWGYRSPAETWPKAKTAAARALELGDQLAEAHTSKAASAAVVDHDWAAAGNAFRRAIDLNPSHPVTQHGYACSWLMLKGSPDEAIRVMRSAGELDPINAFHHTVLGWILHLAGRHDEAMDSFRHTLRLDADYMLAHAGLGWTLEQLGRFEEARASFETAVRLSDCLPLALGSLAHCLGKMGRGTEAAGVIDRLHEMAGHRYVSPVDLAVAHVGQGDHEATYNSIDQAMEERSGRLIWIGLDPRFGPLRGEERFRAVLARMGLS
ncbi:MAG: tetratricopeptide repeat protein [bacterium]|nr:tetratricopeptide repeat protein [bacterium]